MKDKLMLSMTPEVAEAFADCEPGESKTVTLHLTVDSKDAKQLTATVDAIEYEGETTETESAAEEEMPMKSMKSAMPQGVLIAIAPKAKTAADQ